MGWLKLGSRYATADHTFDEELKSTVQHIETVSISPSDSISAALYPLVSIDTPDRKLPFIAPEEVKKRNSVESNRLWIVVDEIVYDCTEYLNEHPGGKQIIRSFGGAECSWQFWRFHGKKEMEEFGRPLRVGRTKAFANRFKEPQKYVGLRRFGGDGWAE